MEIRIRTTGQVLSSDEWIAWASNAYNKSFSGLSVEAINHFESDPVLEGPQAITDEGEISVRDGIQNVNGHWFTKYKAVKDNQA